MKEILLVSDKSYWSNCASLLISSYFENSKHVTYERGDKFPAVLKDWTGDFLISFKSDLIIPPSTLNKTNLYAINFHPAPPKYRGIGGYIEALEKKDDTYGITCHHMDNKIDHGNIIKSIAFPINDNDTSKTLYHKSGFYCLSLLNEVLTIIRMGDPLPKSSEKWGNSLYLFKDYKSRLKYIID